MKSRIILITGASRGIGATLAYGLLEEGHRVVATARSLKSLDFIREQASQLEDGLSRLLTLELDVCTQASVEIAVKTIEERWGTVEILINNAGIAESAPLHKTSDELWQRMLDVNLTGSFRVSRQVLGQMKKLDYGRIIFISSIAGLSGCLYTSAYCASKHGVIGMMRALALEVAQTQVTSNAICPGFVETDMARDAMAKIQSNTQRGADEARNALEAFSPQKRLFQADEILHSVRFLIAP